MKKRVRVLLTAVLMGAALFGASFTAFATSPARPSSGSGTTATDPVEPAPGSTVTTAPVTNYLDDEVVPLAGAGSRTKSKSGSGLITLLDEEVPLASPQTGDSVNMTVVLAVLAGAGSASLLIAGKRPEVALK